MTNIPKSTLDLFSNNELFPADQFFATGRLVSHNGDVNYLNMLDVRGFGVTIDIKGAPVIANNDKTRQEFSISSDDMMTREEFGTDYNGQYNDYYMLSAGSYLWYNNTMPLMIRDHPTIKYGALMNPSGMVDRKPSETTLVETLEESSLVFKTGFAQFLVPVLYDPDNVVLSPYELVSKKSSQHKNITKQLIDKYDQKVDTISYVRTPLHKIEEETPYLRNVKIVHGDTLIDEIDATHVWYQGADDLRIISMHKPYNVTRPHGAGNAYSIDGEPFGREGIFKNQDELMACTLIEEPGYGELVLSFMENYLHQRALYQKYGPLMGPSFDPKLKP